MGSTTKAGKRSPLKHPPLRNPGQSLEEERERIIDDKFILPLIMAVIVVAFAAYEWMRQFTSVPPHPWLLTVLAVAAIAYAAYSIIRKRQQLINVCLGLDGEKVVGQSLEELRSQGCSIFHDIPCRASGRKFNIDHVIIGPQGIFAVETKTYSKPNGRKAIVTYDNDKILVDGREPDRNPIKQTRANRDWLRELLQNTTAKRYPVKGIVLFPGWWVDEPEGRELTDVLVLNPERLSMYIEKAPVVLKEEDIALAVSRLNNYITKE